LRDANQAAQEYRKASRAVDEKSAGDSCKSIFYTLRLPGNGVESSPQFD